MPSMHSNPRAITGIRETRLIGSAGMVMGAENEVVEEFLLVEKHEHPAPYYMRIVELHDKDAVLRTLRELSVQKSLGSNPNLLELLGCFRHRHLVAFIHPPCICLRNCLDTLYHDRRTKPHEEAKSLLDENFAAYVLSSCLAGLHYLHSKGFVHTSIGAVSLFVGTDCAIRLGRLQYTQKIGSTFTDDSGNQEINCHPPEAFHHVGILVNTPSFDVWSVGLLAIELVTGKKATNSRKTLVQVARELIDGVIQPPALTDFGYSSVTVGATELVSFVNRCVRVLPAERPAVETLLQHPLLRLQLGSELARSLWEKYPVDSFLRALQPRSLYFEMLSFGSSCGEINQDLLLRILRASSSTDAEETYFWSDKMAPGHHLIGEFIAVEAAVVCEWEDADASQHVHDVSHNFSSEYIEQLNQTAANSSPGKPAGSRHSLSHQPKVDRLINYRRGELIFFIDRTWDVPTRQTFVALQFTRWFKQGLIRFHELIRVVDELCEVLEHFVPVTLRNAPVVAPPECVGFDFFLRRSASINDSVDKDALKANFLIVEAALHPDAVALKEKKTKKPPFTLEVAEPDKTPLQFAVTYHFPNAQSFDKQDGLEEKRLREWVHTPQHSMADVEGNKLRYLLDERRRNPNRLHVFDPTPSAVSNEARNAKLWSNFDRDFILRHCQLAIPYQVAPELLHPSCPNAEAVSSTGQLHSQLLKTRSKQEEDYVQPIVI